MSLRVAFDNGTRTVVFTATLGADGTIVADVTEPVIVVSPDADRPVAAAAGHQAVLLATTTITSRTTTSTNRTTTSTNHTTTRMSTRALTTMTDIDPLLGRTLPRPSGPPQPPFVPSVQPTTEPPIRATARTSRPRRRHPSGRRADRRCRARRHDDVRAHRRDGRGSGCLVVNDQHAGRRELDHTAADDCTAGDSDGRRRSHRHRSHAA